jgi:hypothetical protein
MVHDGGRWDVGVKDNEVYVARIAEGDKQVFDDVVAPDEARKLADLLTKYADKADEAADSDNSDSTDEPDDSDESEDADEPDDSDESEDSGKSSD